MTAAAWRGSPRAAHRRPIGRQFAWAAAAALALILVALASARLGEVGAERSLAASRMAVAGELQRRHAPPEVAAFYEGRGDQPLWIDLAGTWPFGLKASLRPEAAQMAALAPAAARGRLTALVAAAGRGDPAALGAAEVALSAALADYAAGLRRPVAPARLAFVDPALARPDDPRGVLEEAARAPSLAEHLAGLASVNPVYAALRRDLAAYHAQWARLPQIALPPGPAIGPGSTGERVRLLRVRLGLAAAERPFDAALGVAVRRFQAAHGLEATGLADAPTLAALNAGAAHYEQLIAANLERARALPAIAARRYIVVNVAAGELTFYEAGAARGSMRVVVGKPGAPTPMMAGLIRYLVFNPYWEVPEDLVQASLARKVVAAGPSYLAGAHMQTLSDWSDQAVELDPATVDWRAVAAGLAEVRVRQRPGADNMMGAVKFMLPNELGIYLHDTPNRAAFAASQRLLSAGCVRLEQAAELADWLLGPAADRPTADLPDQRRDLDEPTPVYITYLTAAPGPSGVSFHPDVYGRDPALLAALNPS